MHIKGIHKIESTGGGVKISLSYYTGRDQTIIYMVGADMRINIENSNDIEVFIDDRTNKKKGA